MKRILSLLFVSLLALSSLHADEGMWLPSLIGKQIKDMKSKGFKLTAEDIYSVNKASLKDGIVLFGRGCTGELVSAEGLLLTNHHCGYPQIQKHSSLANDYLTNGFWAMNRGEELPNPGLTVSFLVRMEDVTEKIFGGIPEGIDEQQYNKMVDGNRKSVAEEATEGGRYNASVELLYYGNQAFLFVYEVFRDVRLVGAPPSAIGKFGGDTDNWMWPRHTGDFSVFRIYADKDNKPADYSPDNVPYTPKKHFSISTKGVKPGDFTFVYGFPGTTREYVTSDFIDYTLNYSNPTKIKLRTIRLDVINAAQNSDPLLRIMYASKAAGIANSWKKWQGESLGLARMGTIETKRRYEARFMEWAKDKPVYRDALSNLHNAYEALLPFAMARDYYTEAFSVIELTKPVTTAVRGIRDWAEYAAFYKDYSPEIDRTIAKLLMKEYLDAMSDDFIPERVSEAVDSMGLDAYIDHLFDNSVFASEERCRQLTAISDDAQFKRAVAADPAYEFVLGFSQIYTSKIRDSYNQYNKQITSYYKDYMRGQMEFEPERNFYPDANLTLRIAYGKVEGYSPSDAVWHEYLTTIDGIMEKDNPEIYDYDVPQRLRDIYTTEDYGRWAINLGTRKNPQYTLPVAFIASNHTTGGNSGSPLLNGRGELLGLNFDRTWLSTMSDLQFDPAICRNITVDIRYVLFVIEKIGGAGYLLDEMTLK